jgi:hypothetical protein
MRVSVAKRRAVAVTGITKRAGLTRRSAVATIFLFQRPDHFHPVALPQLDARDGATMPDSRSGSLASSGKDLGPCSAQCSCSLLEPLPRLQAAKRSG